MKPSRSKLIKPLERPPYGGCSNDPKVLTWFRQKSHYKTSVYLDWLDKVRIETISLIGGQTMHWYQIQKVAWGSAQRKV